jgi:hypothetical protein
MLAQVAAVRAQALLFYDLLRARVRGARGLDLLVLEAL